MPDTPFARKPTITGERVILRPVSIEDAEPFFASLDDDEGIRLTGTHQQFTFEQIQGWAASRNNADDRLDLSIIDRAPVTGSESWRSTTGTQTITPAVSGSPSARAGATGDSVAKPPD